MDRAEIKAKLTKITVEHLGVEEAKVTEDANFIDDLGCDSLDVIELCMAFEESFGVEIPDADMDDVVTVSDAINVIQTKVDGK